MAGEPKVFHERGVFGEVLAVGEVVDLDRERSLSEGEQQDVVNFMERRAHTIYHPTGTCSIRDTS